MSAARRSTLEVEQVRLAKQALTTQGLLSTGTPQPIWLPGEIDRSWRRSISAGAAQTPEGLRFVNEFDADSELNRAARPVLDRLEDTLQDMGTAIFLADRSGQIVARRVADRSHRTKFDNAFAAEGFDFSEERIGTNGLGTPLQEGAALFVRGPEHFNEALEHLACAGVGIRHPSTGRLIGSLSLSAPVDAAEMLMLALARQGVQQILENLTLTLGRRELSLGRNYQRHRAKGPVIVLNSDTVMTNVTGLSFLNVEMHARLWDSLVSQDWARGPQVMELDLNPLQARVLAHRLEDTDDDAFAVEILERKSPLPAAAVVRSAPLDPFARTVQRMAARRPGTLAVQGPSGAGKLHVVREWLRSEGHSGVVVFEGGDLQGTDGWRRDAEAALDSGSVVVVRRLEDVDPSQIGVLKSLAGRAAAGRDATRDAEAAPDPDEPPGRLVFTADPGSCSKPVLQLLSQFATCVDVPALASRRQEIPQLAKAILAEVEPGRRPVISAATMQVLMRWDWPGHVAELRHVLLGLASELPGQSVSPYHLPERMWDAANRRSLTRIESAERTEILAALRQSAGNRSKAASLLGIGRTTLYRKLRVLGIDDEALLS